MVSDFTKDALFHRISRKIVLLFLSRFFALSEIVTGIEQDGYFLPFLNGHMAILFGSFGVSWFIGETPAYVVFVKTPYTGLSPLFLLHFVIEVGV
jgi:hypothetical protein